MMCEVQRTDTKPIIKKIKVHPILGEKGEMHFQTSVVLGTSQLKHVKFIGLITHGMFGSN